MDHLHFLCSEKEKQTYLDRITKYASECGCAVGGIFACASLVAAIAGAWLVDWERWNILHYPLAAASGVMIAGLFGKCLGIAIARFRLHLLLGNLRRNKILVH